MTGYLLDTNVISDIRKPRPSPKLRAFLARTPSHQLYISAVTLAEIRKGIAMSPDASKQRDLTAWLEQLRPMLQILPVTEDVLLEWMLAHNRLKPLGISVDSVDLLIAATASVSELTIVTGNVKHFEPIASTCGLRVLNPF